ncbi:MAG TPA: hypothetical protein LFV66_06205 [Rickettsia endosymbiont of Bembidion lapponicum]|nr:hypothetical protein [Rickettsia endosymbiont of Bembidion lapponicum]
MDPVVKPRDDTERTF